jgi:hypothetical protein
MLLPFSTTLLKVNMSSASSGIRKSALCDVPLDFTIKKHRLRLSE